MNDEDDTPLPIIQRASSSMRRSLPDVPTVDDFAKAWAEECRRQDSLIRETNRALRMSASAPGWVKFCTVANTVAIIALAAVEILRALHR